MKKTCAVLLACFISLFCLLSCGLEAFYYIDYIPNSDMHLTTKATIRLPSSSDEGYNNYFTHFMIFYRIYISDIQEDALIASTRTNDVFNKLINLALTSDFAALYSLTDKTSTDVSTSNLENAFYRRNYFLLTLENASITSILDSGSLGRTLVIEFPPNTGTNPTLTLNGGTQYVLLRATEGPGLNFKPQPDRHFLNHPDLYNTANINPQTNPDVATNSKPNILYSYVSMYIAAVGKSYELPPRNIYSQPTFIGVFRLAESS